jgi:hypothetical protein
MISAGLFYTKLTIYIKIFYLAYGVPVLAGRRQSAVKNKKLGAPRKAGRRQSAVKNILKN